MEQPLDEGGTLCAKVGDDKPSIEKATRVDDLLVTARVSLENALDHVQAIADTAVGRLWEPPEQMDMELCIGLNSQAQAVIARTRVEGHLQVPLTWTRPDRATEAAGA